MAHYDGVRGCYASFEAALDPECDLVLLCVSIWGGGRGEREERAEYIAAADAGICDADYHVVGVFDGGDGAVLVAAVAGAVEDAGGILHGG